MAKKKQEEKEVIVKIRKLKVNFELRYDYLKILSEYIKRLPNEHRKIRKDSVIGMDGKPKDDWVRTVSDARIGEIIAFLIDNKIRFAFENITPDVVQHLKEQYLERQRRIAEILKLKAEQLDVSGEDYSFMKIQPYEYQKKAVKFFEINDGKAILGDQPGVGKAQNLDSLIATPDGWIRMGDIKVGQKIFHRDGNAYCVDGVFPQGIQKTYRVIFNDGFYAECNMEHLWNVRDVNRRKRNAGWTTKSLKELVDSGLSYNHSTSSVRSTTNRKPVLKWDVPIVNPMNYPTKNFLISPYVLGALIGYGGLVMKSICISIPDNQSQIRDIIKNLLPEEFKLKRIQYSESACPQYHITRNHSVGANIIKSEIKKFNLNLKSGYKFIPKEYLQSDIEQRIELLRGLMDTNGSADKNRIHYHTSSFVLAQNVSELIQSLGGQALIKKYDRTHEDKGIEWRVNVRINICPFHLEGKKIEWNIKKSNYCSKYIERVEFIKEEEHQCISTKSPDGTYITNNYIVTHNTCPAFAYASKYKLKTLVICPASLKLMWRKEIARFTNEKAFIYKFKPKKKSKIIVHTKEDSLFHIINYESVETYIKLEYKHKCSGKMLQPSGGIAPCSWQQTDLTKKYAKCPICENTGTVKSAVCGLVGFQDDFHQELNPEDYDLIIIDECHRIKELSTSWTKIIHKALKKIPKKILLSGTVIKSRPIEFFSSLNFVFPEEWKNSHEFGVRFCAGHESGYGWDYSGASNLEELFTRASSYFLRRLKKDVLSELPEKTYMEIPIELTDVEYREYKKLEEAVKKVIVNGKEIEKEETFLEKVHKLKLFTGKVKLNRVIEMIEDIISTGEKVVVISDYQEVAKGIYEAFKAQAVLHTGSMSDEDKQNSVDLFQEDPKIKVFSGMVIASGAGLTLTAASKMYRIGFPWTPSECEQVEDRIHRASTTADTIEIITLICQDTIDEDIDELLRDKAYIVTKTLDNKEYKKEATTYNESVYKELLKRLKEK